MKVEVKLPRETKALTEERMEKERRGEEDVGK